MKEVEYAIGLDLGTKCGWSVLKRDGTRLDSGTWDLKAKRHEGGGMRYVRFAMKLRALLATWNYQNSAVGGSVHVAYEEVRRHRGVTAAHIYGALMGTLQSVLDDRDMPVPYVSIPVGTIKKHATGKGNAGKELMISSALARWQEEVWQLGDDNEADALWVASAYLAGLF